MAVRIGYDVFQRQPHTGVLMGSFSATPETDEQQREKAYDYARRLALKEGRPAYLNRVLPVVARAIVHQALGVDGMPAYTPVVLWDAHEHVLALAIEGDELPELNAKEGGPAVRMLTEARRLHGEHRSHERAFLELHNEAVKTLVAELLVETRKALRTRPVEEQAA